MIPLDVAWGELRQAGQLLSLTALASLPSPPRVRSDLAEQLRAALTSLPDDRREGPELSALLDLVLETTLGLAAGWRKGSDLGATDALRLVDGTTLKPRRLWTSPSRAVAGGAVPDLAVFVVDAERIGVGRGRRPVAQAVEYLRRRGVPLALLTTGRTWRLLWADTDNTAWVEWDADRWVHGDQLTESLATFRTVLGSAAITRVTDDASSRLLLAIRDTRRGQAKLSKELGENVRKAVELLLHARKPVLAPVWEQHQGQHVYAAACHLVMRLVVVLFAEARELLPVDNPVYYDAYSLRGLQDQLDRLSGRRAGRTAAWLRLQALSRLIHQGSPHRDLLVPAYGSELFEAGRADSPDPVSRAVALLEDTRVEPPDDEVVWRMLRLLTRTEQLVREGNTIRRVAVPVDFTELTSEYVGILYEGLLDYELRRADDEPIVFLAIGDQPALPLGRLEAMDDKALKALVEKAKVKNAAPGAEGDAEDEGDEDAEGDDEASDDEDASPAPTADDPFPDDARGEALARARRWACGAVVAAGLVKKPKGRAGTDDPAWLADRDGKAAALIAQVVPSGELYLVRWGGTRKGSGTFYTRPALTLPTVRRTLEPLVRTEDGTLRTPEELLKLKVCDPAMGSASFLVAALRVLTTTVIESLHAHRRLRVEGELVSVDCGMLPEVDRRLREERLEAVVRRAVVEQCLYGVDKNPLAVELGRVALWIETLDRSLPLTFLDHKLKKGDALVGCWLDRFTETPILAWWREAGDEKHVGVHHKAGTWAAALAARREQAVEALRVKASRLAGQSSLFGGAPESEALLDGLRATLTEMHALPSRDARRRAEVYRTRVVGSDAYQQLRGAMDRWCALWFWPGDQLDAAPLDVGESSPDVDARVARLSAEHRFFHWELEFPDVFYRGSRGFHAVVGNPPWEIQKPNSKEFFSNHDPLYRAYGKQEALRRQRELFAERPAVERAWLDEQARLKARGNFVRHAAFPFGDGRLRDSKDGRVSLSRKQAEDQAWHEALAARRSKLKGFADPEHPFRHQGGADLNTYKLFTEAAHALLRPGGQLGLIVPSGLYTDKGTADLRKLLLDRCTWRWLYGFENRDKIFDIHRSFKFAVVIAGKGGRTEAFQAAFMRHELEDWSETRDAFEVAAAAISALSPTDFAVPELPNRESLSRIERVAARNPALGVDASLWNVRYYCDEFHTSKDSRHFPPLPEWVASGFVRGGNTFWHDSNGEIALPIIEGRMVGAFRINVKGWESGKGRGAVWHDVSADDTIVRPQYLISRRDSREYANYGYLPGPRLVFKDVTSATNSRSAIGTYSSRLPCAHSAPFLRVGEDVASTLKLTAIFNSYVFDALVRVRMGGLHLTYNILSVVPVPEREIVPDSLVLLAARLALAGEHFSPEWMTLRYRCSGHTWRSRWAMTRSERCRLRCMVDAIVATIYGLGRDDLTWILKDCDHSPARLAENAFCRKLDPKGFWRVDNSEDPELRHTVLSVVAFDDLQAAIAACGDMELGIRNFCDQNDGDGWMLPETLCVAELGMTRTVDVGAYDERARAPQPVRERLGPRFFDWQLAQSVEESWAECERHAKAMEEGVPAPGATERGHGRVSALDGPQQAVRPRVGQPSLFGDE